MGPVRAYIAGDFRDRSAIRAIAARLSLLNPELQWTYEWWENEPVASGVTSITYRTPIAVKEVEAVATADVMFFVGPGRRGAATELGVALGNKLPVFAWMPTEESYTVRTPDMDSSNLFLSHYAVRRTYGGHPTSGAVARLQRVYEDWRNEVISSREFSVSRRPPFALEGPAYVASPVALDNPAIRQQYDSPGVGQTQLPRIPPNEEPFQMSGWGDKLPPWLPRVQPDP